MNRDPTASSAKTARERASVSSTGTAISRQSLASEVAHMLRDMIAEGELPAGLHIPERMLCERFSISRTPLREALKVLASEGLVELLPHRGAKVAVLRPDQVEELFDVIGALESLSGKLACRKITDRELSEIRALHYQMVLHYKTVELSDYFRVNQEIHEKIIEIADNAQLSSTYQSLAGRIRRYRYMANLSPERWKEAVAEHELMLEALGERDGERLAKILEAHLRNKCDVVKAAVAEEAKSLYAASSTVGSKRKHGSLA